ncbi:uncharacterized protein METZ01_LOCUS287151, partial [marine metagenome]
VLPDFQTLPYQACLVTADKSIEPKAPRAPAGIAVPCVPQSRHPAKTRREQFDHMVYLVHAHSPSTSRVVH